MLLSYWSKQVTWLTTELQCGGKDVATGKPLVMVINETDLRQVCALIFIILCMRKSGPDSVNLSKGYQPYEQARGSGLLTPICSSTYVWPIHLYS